MPSVLVKRSSVAGRVPATGDLALGEIAVNTYDGKLYIKKDNGTASVVEIGASTGVTSFNTRTGTVTLSSGDVTTALGFTPYNATNPSSYITSSALTPYLTTSTAATTYQPLDGDLTAIAGIAGTTGFLKKTAANTWSLDTSTYLTGITSGQVTTALGFTPYNATNPSGYTSNTGTVTSVGGTGTVSGLSLSGTVTTTGNLTLGGTLAVTASNFASQTANTILAAPTGIAGVPTFRALVAADIPTLNQNTTGTAANVTGTVAVANGGTGAITAAAALANLGAYAASNPSGYTSNTGTVTGVTGTAPIISSGGTAPAISISAATTLAAGSMSAADKTKLDGVAAGATANTGTVTSVGGTGTVSGLSLSGTVTTTGSLTLGGTLSVAASNFASQTANTVLVAPNGTAGVPTFRALASADIPTLNQNTTGTASNVTGTVSIANGGTGATTAATALTNLGAYAASNPAGYTSNTGTVTGVTGTAPIISSGGAAPAISISAATTLAAGSMSAADKTKLDGVAAGATANTGTVTSVAGTGTVSGLSLSGTVTTTGSLTLGGTLSVAASNFASQTANTVLIAPNGVAGVPTFRALVAADIPTLNQNTTGTASNVTGTVAITNGGTGSTTAAAALTALGAYAASNPAGYISAVPDNSVTAAKIASGAATLQKLDTTGALGKILTAAGSGVAPTWEDNIRRGTVNAGGTTPFPASGGPTTVQFTGIPSWAKRISVSVSGVSTSGSSLVIIQFGSTTFTTSGYAGSSFAIATGGATGVVALSSGFMLDGANAATYLKHGLMTAALLNSSTNLWAANGTFGNSDITRGATFGGSVALSGVLDRVRITTVNGTDTFDAGSINIFWE